MTFEDNVGDNLGKTPLANNDIYLYRRLKKKLENCGGNGQCGFVPWSSSLMKKEFGGS